MVGDLVYRIKLFCQTQFNLISKSTITSPQIRTHVLLGISESHESCHDSNGY